MSAFRLKQGQGHKTSAAHLYPSSLFSFFACFPETIDSRWVFFVPPMDPTSMKTDPYILNITSYPFLKDYYLFWQFLHRFNCSTNQVRGRNKLRFASKVRGEYIFPLVIHYKLSQIPNVLRRNRIAAK